MWTVTVDKSVLKRLERIPNPEKARLIQAIANLGVTPETMDINPLTGRTGYRLRVGDWRLLLDMDTEAQKISVYTLASRGDVYKK